MRRDQALRFFSSWDERNTAMMACAEFAPRPSREGCRYCPTGEKAPPFDPPILLSFFVRLRSILLRTAPIPAASSRCATAIVTGEPMSRCVSSTAAETASPFRFGHLFFAPNDGVVRFRLRHALAGRSARPPPASGCAGTGLTATSGPHRFQRMFIPKSSRSTSND